MDTSVDKCLAFCQTLAMSGQKFTFSLSIGKDNFSFNNKELASSSCVKKKSPSQIRRELRRREERTVKNAAAESTAKVAEVNGAEETVSPLGFKCSQCDLHSNSEEELKTHMKDEHTIPILSTPEKERLPDQSGELILTPVCGERSEEVSSLDHPKELEYTTFFNKRTRSQVFQCKHEDCFPYMKWPDLQELKFHDYQYHGGPDPK